MNSQSLEDTKKFAYKLIKNIGNTKFILLNGKIGVGKTTLVQFIAQALGETKPVLSPTFNIMNVYDKFVHIDAYKISGTLEEYEDYFEDKLVIVEWSDNLSETFLNSIKINIFVKDGVHIHKIQNTNK